MQIPFRQTYQISAIHLDRFGRVKPSVLLHFAQEAAGAHCYDLAVDWDTLAEKHLFWAVTRHRVQFYRMPTAGETVTVETWPMPTTRVAYPRSTVIYDAQGNEIFRSVSLWVLMNTDSRSMVLPGKSGIEVNGALCGTELAPPASILPAKLACQVCRTVGYTELDRNGHMNNTRYLDWLDDLLPSAFHAEHPIRELTICYLAEATEGQELELNWELTDGPCLQVDAFAKRENDSENPQRIFAARAQF